MKQKYWSAVIGALAVVVLLGMTGNLPSSLGGAKAAQGTAAAPVVQEGTQAAIDVVCYDVTSNPIDGKVGATITVGGKTTVQTGGVVSYDLNAGFKSGDKLTVTCMNNSGSGYYRSDVPVELKAGTNTVNVPVKKVGTIVPQLGASKSASLALTVGLNGYVSDAISLVTSAQKQFFYKPVIGCKDATGNSTITNGDVTDIQISGFTSVGCDSNVLSGNNFCAQSQKEWVSTDDFINNQLIWVKAGTGRDPAGTITCTIQDGVPMANAGVLSINDADAYSTTATPFAIVVA